MSTISGSSRARTAGFRRRPRVLLWAAAGLAARRGSDLARHGTGQPLGAHSRRARHQPRSPTRSPGIAVGLLDINKHGEGDRVLRRIRGRHQRRLTACRGLVADAGAVPETVRFLNPALYMLAGTSALHDVTPVTSRCRPLSRGRVYVSRCAARLWLTTFDDENWSMIGYTARSQGRATTPCPGSAARTGSPSSTACARSAARTT